MQIGCGLFGVLKVRSKYKRLIYDGIRERFIFLTFRQDGRRVANRVCNPFCFQPRIMRSPLRVLPGGAAVENVSKNTGAPWEIPGCMGGWMELFRMYEPSYGGRFRCFGADGWGDCRTRFRYPAARFIAKIKYFIVKYFAEKNIIHPLVELKS